MIVVASFGSRFGASQDNGFNRACNRRHAICRQFAPLISDVKERKEAAMSVGLLGVTAWQRKTFVLFGRALSQRKL